MHNSQTTPQGAGFNKLKLPPNIIKNLKLCDVFWPQNREPSLTIKVSHSSQISKIPDRRNFDLQPKEI